MQHWPPSLLTTPSTSKAKPGLAVGRGGGLAAQDDEAGQACGVQVRAGRVLEHGDVAIMMVEAESTPETLKLLADSGHGAVAPTEDTVAEGLEAAKPFIRALCEAQTRLAAESAEAEGAAHAEYPVFVDYTEDVYEAVAREVSGELAEALTIAGKHDREAETDRVKALAAEKLAEQFEGREKEISAAFRSLTKKLVRERIIRDGVRIDGRGLTDIRPLSAMTHVLPRGCTAPRCSSGARPRSSA
jgi:polyribonucleotide nucleotidyltransferase